MFSVALNDDEPTFFFLHSNIDQRTDQTNRSSCREAQVKIALFFCNVTFYQIFNKKELTQSS